jgi:hypothetical protein
MGRQPFVSELSPGFAGLPFINAYLLTWGYARKASLHPRLYANAHFVGQELLLRLSYYHVDPLRKTESRAVVLESISREDNQSNQESIKLTAPDREPCSATNDEGCFKKLE